MAKKVITVTSTPVAVVAGSACLSVSVQQAIGELPAVSFRIYDANQILLQVVTPNGNYQFNAGTGQIYSNGQVVGYVSVFTGTNHFSVQDNNEVNVPISLPNTVALSANGAIPVASGTYAITKAGVAALTLANPVPGGAAGGGDDGKKLVFIDTTGHAHTITTAALAIDAADDLATFGGTIGGSITLEAYNGTWYSKGTAQGVTLSEV